MINRRGGLAVLLLVLATGGCSLVFDGDEFRAGEAVVIDSGAPATDAAEPASDSAPAADAPPAASDGGLDGSMGPSDAGLGDAAGPRDAASVDGAVSDAGMTGVLDGSPGGDAAAPDGAAPADAPAPDAIPPPPDIVDVSPDQLLEGRGSSALGPGHPVVLIGTNFASDAAITVGTMLVTVGPTTVSSDGTMAAAVLRLPIDMTLDQGEMRDLTITISQASGEDSIAVPEIGLDELSVAGPTFSTDVPVRPRYSQIRFPANVRITGTTPARLVSTGDIVIEAAVNASGGDNGSAGAGGCGGGTAGVSGGCAPGGGGPGGAGSGGGGGGGGTAGDGGGGDSPGMAGAAVGVAMVTPLGGSGARGNGGGGGGNGAVAGAGGQGGGGGGIIDLSAFGTIQITGSLKANGGNGQGGTGVSCSAHGGGGGGGSGGVLLLRAFGDIAGGGGPLIAARGGSGGSGGAACARGGDGGNGRIRIDAPSAGFLGLIELPAPVRGPMWASTTPEIVASLVTPLTLVGQPSTTFGVRINDGAALTVSTDGSGSVTFNATLRAGDNTLCALVSPLADSSLPEAKNCRDLAALP